MLHEKNTNQSLLDELKNVKEVTKENIKTYKGFENLTEDDSIALILTLETFCEVLLNQAQRNLL